MDKRKKVILCVAAIVCIVAALSVAFFTDGETSTNAVIVAPIPAVLLCIVAAINANKNKNK